MLFEVIVLTLMRKRRKRFHLYCWKLGLSQGIVKILRGLLCLSVKKLGLQPGFVVDLNALKPWNGIAWNMCKPKGGDELMDFLDEEDPELVIGSSSCDVSDFLKGSKCALENQTDFLVCARACARQHQRGKVFLHEAEGQGHLMDRIIS